jgi:hypothetical protein
VDKSVDRTTGKNTSFLISHKIATAETKKLLTIRTIQKGEKAILGPILEARMAIQVIS